MGFEKIEVPKVKKVVKNGWDLDEFLPPGQKDALDYASVQTGQAYDETYVDGAEIGTSYKEKPLEASSKINKESFDSVEVIQDTFQKKADADKIKEQFEKRNKAA